MSFKVDFDSLAWKPGLPGSRAKTVCHGEQQIRLVEFTSDFIEPDWCTKAHIGLILEGELEIDLRGSVILYRKGDGVLIPAGKEHKAKSIAPVTRLILFERA